MEIVDVLITDEQKPLDPIPWPDKLDDAPWPSPYRAFSDPCTETEPRFTRRTVMALAPIVASWFLEDTTTVARKYAAVSSLFQEGLARANLFADYQDVLVTRLKIDFLNETVFNVFNEHDLANIHRAVWLTLYRAIVCMMDINLHGDWGDPPAGGTTQGREGYTASGSRGFHTIPNGYGSFAISTLDFAPPDVGIGEAAAHAQCTRFEGDTPGLQIREISRALARALIAPAAKDNALPNADRYLAVVKSFYRDRKNHVHIRTADGDQNPYNADYQTVIEDLVSGSVTEPLPPLTDDDFADIHRGTWLFLVNRFYHLIGKAAFGPLVDVPKSPRSRCVPLKMYDENGYPIVRTFAVPNEHGAFNVNLIDVDPDLEPILYNPRPPS